MHRSTPADTLRRAYDSGGARTCIDTVDDSRMMQEMAGNFMKGESRKALEAAQNYGFSSVVMPATKGKDGSIEECAEGFISFLGGNRSFPVCTVMDDRRHRPMQLPAGASAQYGPNTDYGRALTLIKPTPQDQGSGSGGSSGGGGARAASGSSGGGGSGEYGAFMVVPHPQEYASMRHINNKKQPRPQGAMGAQQGGGGQSQQGGQQQQQYNHEKGDSINTEVRCTNSRIEFRSGDTVVGYYDKSSGKWSFTGEIHLGVDSAAHRVYGVQSNVGMTTASSGSGAVLVNATQPGPPTSQDNQPLEAIYARIVELESRVAGLEDQLSRLGG